MSVADQESIAGPSQRTEAQAAEVQRLLTHLEGWVNFPRVMLDVGVTQRSLIPLERLRYEASRLETIRLQHLAGRVDGRTEPHKSALQLSPRTQSETHFFGGSFESEF